MAGDRDDGNPLRVARAYDAIAPRYDRLLESDAWVRQVLWRHYDDAFRAGQHVLDLACGTGIDAIFLAQRGVRVTAIDASQGMLDRLHSKIGQLGLEAMVDVRRHDVGALESGDYKGIDGIVSGFAGLNTIENLDTLVDNAADWLRTRGRMVVQMLTRDGVKGRSAARADRPADDETTTIAVCGQPVDHLCLPASEIYHRYFSARFHRRRVCGQGFMIPAPLLARMPAVLLPWLGRFESRIGVWRPFLDRSRFCIIDLERRSDSPGRPVSPGLQHAEAGS